MQRRVGEIHGGGTGASPPVPSTKMGFGLRPVIQAEDALDHIVQVSGDVDLAGAAAIFAGGVVVFFQLDAKGRVHGRD